MRQVVAGVDHQVGLEVGQRADPGQLAVLAGSDVQVADVQDPERPVARWEHRRLGGAQGEPADLDARRVGEAGGTCGSGQGGQAECTSHGPRLRGLTEWPGE